MDEGYLDEARFAESYLASRSSRGFGPRRIEFELREKGVDKSTIRSTMDACAEDWFANADKARAKKFDTKPSSGADRAKQSRFLQQRGFFGEHIQHALDSKS